MKIDLTRGAWVACATLLSVSGAILLLKQHGVRFLIGGLMVAVGLYVIRDAFRLGYALAEIGFALFLLWNVADLGKGEFSAEFNPDEFNVTGSLSVVVLQSMGAVYVLVRGLDNLTKALGWPKQDWYHGR